MRAATAAGARASRSGARFGRRAIVAGVALVIVLGAGTVAAIHVALDSDTARRAVAAKLEAITGQPVAIDGDIGFSLLPGTRLTLDRVVIGADPGLSVERVVADLDAASALFGQVQIGRILAIRPEYAGPLPTIADVPVDDAQTAVASRGAFVRAVATTIMRRFGDLERLELQQALFRPRGEDATGFSNGDLTIVADADDGPLRVEGSAVWNGQPTDFDLTLDDPRGLSREGESAVRFALSSTPMALDFDGAITAGRTTEISGHLAAETASFSRGVEWLLDTDTEVPTFGAARFESQVVMAGARASFRNVDLTISGSRAEGAIEGVFDGPVPRFDGTLAFRSLDFSPFARSIAPLPDDPLDFERPIDISFASKFAFDLRLSTPQARFGPLEMRDLAAVLAVEGGGIRLDVGQVATLGGTGQARFSFGGSGPSAHRAHGEISAQGVRASALVDLMNVDEIDVTGPTRLEARFDAPLTDWAHIIDVGRASGSIAIAGGTLTGFDPMTFATPGARPIATGLGDEPLAFSDLSASLSANGPRIAIDALAFETARGRLDGSGRYGATTRQIAISGRFRQAESAALAATEPAAFTPSQPTGFTVTGDWPQPTVFTR